MNEERCNTFELAKVLASLDYDEFIDVINYCGEFDSELWADLTSEAVFDDALSDGGKKLLEIIALYGLDGEINLLVDKLQDIQVSLPDGRQVDAGTLIINWWNELWRRINYE